MPLTVADVPLEELLPSLADRAATGTLSITTARNRKRLYLVDGRLAGIGSDNPRDLLGHFLVGWGLIGVDQLSDAMRVHEELGTPVGHILERMGAVAPDDLKLALRAQAEEALFDVFLQPIRDMRFLEHTLPADRPLSLRLALPELVVEGLRRRQRHDEIRRTLGGLDVIPSTVDSGPPPFLSSRDRLILAQIDGTRDADAIALLCHVAPFQVAELIERGVREGFVAVTRPSAAAAAPGPWDLARQADAALAAGNLRPAWEALEALRGAEGGADTMPEVGRIQRLLDELLVRIRTSGHLVPRPARTGLATTPPLRPGEAFVLSRVNDRWSLDEIARITPVSAMEFGVIVDTLQRLGLVELRDPSPPPARP
jgi:hypothetical protein